MNTSPDQRKFAPATQRNREPILEVLLQILPQHGTVLEIASGTGEHATFFSYHLAPRQWLPSDPNPELLASISAWAEFFPCDVLQPPVNLDASSAIWAVETEPLPELPISAIVNINMIHISPWSACLGLMAGAGRILPPGGILYLYGPYKQDGEHTAPSNAAFDESLQAENPDWGVRNLEDVITAAAVENLTLQETRIMPANNLSLIFKHN
ncbi:MAG: DUF938 domain-containing protein [Dolichospermum sp. DET50]|nr:DUF938 domain-containing protein [Dolichospermum sp. DET66]MBS3031183.1 DUF938 domain-containing protein [Dolichospermum sp. DET67]MBS3036393.1 DUF938 domain-containing protein [Dolichospermum sp. DET50]QSX68451.1 MAG: DUF938 domain-containing protein [Dolichospermum sp. DET69]